MALRLERPAGEAARPALRRLVEARRLGGRGLRPWIEALSLETGTAPASSGWRRLERSVRSASRSRDDSGRRPGRACTGTCRARRIRAGRGRSRCIAGTETSPTRKFATSPRVIGNLLQDRGDRQPGLLDADLHRDATSAGRSRRLGSGSRSSSLRNGSSNDCGSRTVPRRRRRSSAEKIAPPPPACRVARARMASVSVTSRSKAQRQGRSRREARLERLAERRGRTPRRAPSRSACAASRPRLRVPDRVAARRSRRRSRRRSGRRCARRARSAGAPRARRSHRSPRSGRRSRRSPETASSR